MHGVVGQRPCLERVLLTGAGIVTRLSIMDQWLALLREFSTLIAGIVGVAVGAITAALTTRSNRKNLERQLQWQADQERQAEVRRRADDKAIEILGLLQELDRLLARRIILSRSEVVAREDQKELRRIRSQLTLATVYLPAPVRTQVRSVHELIGEAERLSYQGYVEHDAQVVVRVTSHAAQDAVGQYLRGEPVSQPPRHVANYLKALRDLEHQEAVELEREFEESEKLEKGQITAAGGENTSRDAD